ncbi:methyltransferase domain-containing protein [Streptomyces sp. SP17BM10]|uniref:methyltransferase domain-containing protein n=1 Tax=Streptomyces sp. SP17BM10 TaxID=3002530 RepID=UPI002E77C466|nr:methyltransferase domain-containing protein [Streptomyces sp. SP17BM10]MEE1781637.1 methyltransferase domain-containing protein [Streptomyces sp. SP17BM10]
MTTTTESDAGTLRAAMVDALTADGSLTDPAWQRAFRDVPRHLFVPYFYRQGADGRQQRISGDDPGQAGEWLRSVYENRPLVTHLIDGNAASSSTQPSLMAVMLQALGELTTPRVKEIGTGTGYNAALLSRRYGHDQVVTVDVDPDVTTAARQRLAAAGYQPTVITADGAVPAMDGPAFGAIVATCGLDRIPPAWLAELADDGVIVAPLGSGVVSVVKTSDTEATGGFLATPAYFMPLRAEGDSGIIRRPALPDGDGRRTELGVGVVVDESFRFLVSVALGPLGWNYELADDGRPVGACLWDGAGSVAELRADGIVCEEGPRALWSDLEAVHRLFVVKGRPARDRYGITITAGEQRVWLDDPDGPRWLLPA